MTTPNLNRYSKQVSIRYRGGFTR